jgi:hypothetical protein
MVVSQVWPGPSLEGSAHAGEIAGGIHGNSYASAYMHINPAQVRLGRLTIVRMDGDSKKRRH